MVNVTVVELLVLTPKTPAIQCSSDCDKLLLVVVPHEPDCSPSPISSIFNKSENVDAILFYPYT